MNTILKSVNPSELVHSSNVRGQFQPPEHHVSGRDSNMDELIASVRMFGVMQPITARRQGGKLLIVYGHRRAYAAAVAKLPTVPVLVQDLDPDEIVARQLIENIQRQALDLAETAAGVRKLYEEHRVTAMVAEMLGKSAAWVSKMLTITAPGKSSHAQHLLKCDRLHDLELAYLLCRLEALDPGAAADAAHRIFHDLAPKVTRETLQQAIEKATKKAQPDDDDSDDDGEDGEDATPAVQKAGAPMALYLTEPERMMLQNALDAYTTSPAEHGMKIGLLTRMRG